MSQVLRVAWYRLGAAFAQRRGGLGVQRPAQIVNYRTIGSTPIVLAVGLAAGPSAPSA